MENKPLPEFGMLYVLWCQDPQRQHLRFGQWFIINFDRKTTNPDLFYEPDSFKALRMVAKQYYSLDIPE